MIYGAERCFLISRQRGAARPARKRTRAARAGSQRMDGGNQGRAREGDGGWATPQLPPKLVRGRLPFGTRGSQGEAGFVPLVSHDFRAKLLLPDRLLTVRQAAER